MAEYIDKEQLLSELYSKQDEPLDVMKEIANFSAADVAPVVHGKWIMKDKGTGVCSNCNRQDQIHTLSTHCRYSCAKMDFGGSD